MQQLLDSTTPSAVARATLDPAGGDAADPTISLRAAELDLADSQSILLFGSSAQDELTRIADSMLEQVRNKDLGGAGEALSDMVTVLREFDSEADEAERAAGWFDRLLGRQRGAARLLQRYESVRDQLDLLTARLEQHQTRLLIDIETLDRLYDANLDYLADLDAYIAAGERRLAEIDRRLPAEGLPAPARASGPLAAQLLQDLRAARDNLDRRLHDLRLTRQVTLQNLPGAQAAQELTLMERQLRDALASAHAESAASGAAPAGAQRHPAR